MNNEELAAHIEAIIQRRMKNTGENYDTAREHIARELERSMNDRLRAPEGWVEKWLDRPAPPKAPTRELFDFFSRMSEACQRLVIKFPPYSVVRWKETGHIAGYVHHYAEREGRPLLVVHHHPESQYLGDTNPEDVELVGCRPGLGSDRIADLIAAWRKSTRQSS